MQVYSTGHEGSESHGQWSETSPNAWTSGITPTPEGIETDSPVADGLKGDDASMMRSNEASISLELKRSAKRNAQLKRALECRFRATSDRKSIPDDMRGLSMNGFDGRARQAEIWDAFASAHQASIIYKATGNPRAVQILLGHKNIETRFAIWESI